MKFAAQIRRVSTTTLGCRVNSFETEQIVSQLGADHWVVSSSGEQVALCVINTCTVTAEADRQARQAVRRSIKNNPDALVVVTGCYAQMSPEECASIPGVDLVVGNSKKLDIHRLIPLLERGELPKVLVETPDEAVGLPKDMITGFQQRSRAFVQIQQGCDQGCTFCIIHTARGKSRSFSVGVIRRQVERLVMNGFKEIVICGIDLGDYGADLDTETQRKGLSGLLEKLLEIEGDFRIRLGSIDPAHITDALISLLQREPERLCRHLHVSVQSANTLILKRMKRRYGRTCLYARMTTLRRRIPQIHFSADIMVGFPTESEQHFSDTLDAISDLGIVQPHVFIYSPRSGTPASRIPASISKSVSKQRAALIRQSGKKMMAAAMFHLLGSIQHVLVESRSENSLFWRARTSHYLFVDIASDEDIKGALVYARIIGMSSCGLVGQVVN